MPRHRLSLLLGVTYGTAAERLVFRSFTDALVDPLLRKTHVTRARAAACHLSWPPTRASDPETPRWAWIWSCKAPIVRLLVYRMYVLQYVILNNEPGDVAYWATVMMDQHVPLLLWLKAHQRAPSYVHDVVPARMEPDHVVPLCEHTLAMGQYTIADVASPAARTRKNDILYMLLKTLPRRCVSRDLERLALETVQRNKDPRVLHVIMCTALGNYRRCEPRADLLSRLRLHAMGPAEYYDVAKASPAIISYALSEFLMKTINNLPSYADAIQTQMKWKDFCKNTSIIATFVIRNTLQRDPRALITARDINQWRRTSRESPHNKRCVPRMSILRRTLRWACNIRGLAGQPTLTHLATALRAESRNQPGVYAAPPLSSEDGAYTRRLLRKTPSRPILTAAVEAMSDSMLLAVTGAIIARDRAEYACLIPLPLRAEVWQARYRAVVRCICPVCHALNFKTRGRGDRKAASSFQINSRDDFVTVCIACSDRKEGVPVLPIDMTGCALKTPRGLFVLCCACGACTNVVHGCFGHPVLYFTCKDCARKPAHLKQIIGAAGGYAEPAPEPCSYPPPPFPDETDMTSDPSPGQSKRARLQ